MVFRACAIVPTYRHVARLPALAQRLALEVPVIVVDDGNGEPEKSAIAALHDPAAGITVLRRKVNGGKGAAVKSAFAAALEFGYTHALQVDADGQHDIADAGGFLEAAREQPLAVICGAPVFDASIPRARKFGRHITHFWVWVETASFAIRDSMCGFRVYPLDAVRHVLKRERIGDRMDFDTEIAVHLYWAGAPFVNLPTRVIYPPDNTSNFRMLADNVRISAMHTRLALQMPGRVFVRALRGGRPAWTRTGGDVSRPASVTGDGR